MLHHVRTLFLLPRTAPEPSVIDSLDHAFPAPSLDAAVDRALHAHRGLLPPGLEERFSVARAATGAVEPPPQAGRLFRMHARVAFRVRPWTVVHEARQAGAFELIDAVQMIRTYFRSHDRRSALDFGQGYASRVALENYERLGAPRSALERIVTGITVLDLAAV
jgi:hypothetical protein